MPRRRPASPLEPTFHVDDVLVCKSPDHVKNAVDRSNVGQEGVAEPSALCGALDEAGNISDREDSWDDALGLVGLHQVVEAVVGDGHPGQWYKTESFWLPS